jgi:voltage-gated potassium channel
MRLFRIFKILRYFGSIDVIYSVLKKNWDALLSVFCILIVFLIFTSYSIYIFESDVQPEKFQDFDNSFWWAIVTLTTVGYGDIYPISDVGKLLTIITLLIGIMIIALPTGILISGFIEEMRLCRVRSNPVQPVFVADELRKIQALKDEGIITEGEYEILKKNLIREL